MGSQRDQILLRGSPTWALKVSRAQLYPAALLSFLQFNRFGSFTMFTSLSSRMLLVLDKK
jgi:hypothetical protein